jgi:hypothetical protein
VGFRRVQRGRRHQKQHSSGELIDNDPQFRFERERLSVLLSKSNESRALHLPKSVAESLRVLKKQPVVGAVVFWRSKSAARSVGTSAGSPMSPPRRFRLLGPIVVISKPGAALAPCTIIGHDQHF